MCVLLFYAARLCRFVTFCRILCNKLRDDIDVESEANLLRIFIEFS